MNSEVKTAACVQLSENYSDKFVRRCWFKVNITVIIDLYEINLKGIISAEIPISPTKR